MIQKITISFVKFIDNFFGLFFKRMSNKIYPETVISNMADLVPVK